MSLQMQKQKANISKLHVYSNLEKPVNLAEIFAGA